MDMGSGTAPKVSVTFDGPTVWFQERENYRFGISRPQLMALLESSATSPHPLTAEVMVWAQGGISVPAMRTKA